MNSSTTDPAAAPNPVLSVVVASFSDGALLYKCLDALTAQAGTGTVEVLVVRDVARTDGFDGAVARRQFPLVRWIQAPPACTVPRLRSLGVAASRGEVVGLLEDDCVVQEHWREAAVSVARSPFVAVGGVVEPGPYTRALDWGVYFCEYARFMKPTRKSACPPLPGNNAVYKRTALLALNVDEAAGFQEAFAQAKWQAAGMAMTTSDDLVVRNVNNWPARQVTAVPFHHGRAYAARRFETAPMIRRLAIAAAALGLPVLKTLRIFAETSTRRRLTGRLLLSLPWVIAFTTCWSAGEAMGCLFGPGTSPSQWR